MSAPSILTEIRSAGLKVEPRGENLWVEPINGLSPELRARLVEHKGEIIAYLKSQPEPTEETYSDPLDLRDLSSFPVQLLDDLSLQPCLVLAVPGIDTPVIFDFRPKPTTWRRQPNPRHPTFDLDEITALIEATENGRIHPRGFALWCQRKTHEPHWRLDRGMALQGAPELLQRTPKPKGWTVGKLLKAVGAELRLITVNSYESQTVKQGPYCRDAR